MDYKYNNLILSFRGNLGLICSLRRSHPQLSPMMRVLEKTVGSQRFSERLMSIFLSHCSPQQVTHCNR